MKCNICEKEMHIIKGNIHELAMCDSCKFIAKIKGLSIGFDEQLSRYKCHDNNNPDYIKYQSLFYSEIKDYLGSSNLDFGCGEYHVLSNILDSNGVEAYYYDKFFYPNVEYKNKHYDSIILEEVIEHLEAPFETLVELKSLLNAGGSIIIRTRLTDNVDLANWWYLRDQTHISFFSIETFKFIASKLKMNVRFTNNIDIVVLS